MNIPRVREYIESKERAIREIQKGIQEKAKAIELGAEEIEVGIQEKTATVAAGIKEIEKRMDKFKQEWY